jgi:hypothetical protein
MKGVLLLGVVGAAIYTALVVSHDLLQSDRADHRLSSQGLTSPTTRQLRSWGHRSFGLSKFSGIVAAAPQACRDARVICQ